MTLPGSIVGTMTLLAISAPAAELSGVVRYPDTDRFAVERGELVLYRNSAPAANPIARTKTGKSGHYAFTGLAAGTHDLDVRVPSFAGLKLRGIILAEDQRLIVNPRLAVGCGDTSLTFLRYLPDSPEQGNLTGKLLQARLSPGRDVDLQSPLEDAKVTLVCETGEACGATRTDPDGSYGFSGLKPGRYALKIEARGYYVREAHPYAVLAHFETVSHGLGVEQCAAGDCTKPQSGWVQHPCLLGH